MIDRRGSSPFVAAVVAVAVALLLAWPSGAQQASAPVAERFQGMSRDAEAKGLADPYRGISTEGKVIPGLFPIRSTGVSTAPVRRAAERFLVSLTAQQRKATIFAVDDPEWRKWMNQHFYVRQGVSVGEMNRAQRAAAFGLLDAALSAKGLKLTRDVMRLNETLAELKSNWQEYGEGRYWITVMGTPSPRDPWGFQIDGHHLIVNYFVLGDQVVMTPSFWGSEPVVARSGKYRGTAVLQQEQDQGLRMLEALSPEQRKKAVIAVSKTGNDNVAEAFKDNLTLAYAGLRASELSPAQKQRLVALVALYVNNMDDGHAKVKMDDVRRHLDDTYFAWIGGAAPSGVFYYRVHSPVILIEFDHQKPVALGDRGGPPTRDHIHVVVRTPNGNDYGKDLLRQHHAAHPHPHGP
jgi:hypothetical protein